MAKFKIVVSDPISGKAETIEVEGDKASPWIGKKIGDVIEGIVIGIPGKRLLITGGSDKDGFPMRVDVHGGVKTRVLLSGGTGFKPKNKGERRRKIIRGNIITEDIVQINVKVIEGDKTRQSE